MLGTRYTDDFTTFIVTPLNDSAFTYLSSTTIMSEETWIALLYEMRNRKWTEQEYQTYLRQVQLSLNFGGST